MTQKAQNRQGKFVPNHRKRIHFEERLNQLPEITAVFICIEHKISSFEAEGSLDEKIFTTRDERGFFPYTPPPTPYTLFQVRGQEAGVGFLNCSTHLKTAIKSACLAFDITVTGEEVENG